jgi:glucose-1-phosphate cytidylyltransferase
MMKVVLFCGGLGMRLREHSESIPKPMITVGYRPILWHIMRYYAHFGHNDFILCLGYKADVIKNYFLDYNEALSSDFTLTLGHRQVDIQAPEASGWNITFTDTGLYSNLGQRLMAVRPYVARDEIFLANYGDVLTDAPLNDLVDEFSRSDKLAAFLSVRPNQTFHVVCVGDDHLVSSITHVNDSDIRINGGYFMFKQGIFDYVRPGEELVEEPFKRLIADRLLMAFQYDGFWAPMDTLKEMQMLEHLYNTGEARWALWNKLSAPVAAG